MEGSSGNSFDVEGNILPVSQPRKIRLKGFHFQPDRIELGDTEERISCFEILPFLDFKLHDDAVL